MWNFFLSKSLCIFPDYCVVSLPYLNITKHITPPESWILLKLQFFPFFHDSDLGRFLVQAAAGSMLLRWLFLFLGIIWSVCRAANQYETSVFWYGNGLSSTGVRTEGKKYGNKKLPTWFQLSFCTPTQIIYWSGHDGVAFLLITSGLKWLKHNPHYHKNNKPQDLIQLRYAPVRPITFDTGGSHVLKPGAGSNKRCDWSSSQFAWDSSAFRPMNTSLI